MSLDINNGMQVLQHFKINLTALQPNCVLFSTTSSYAKACWDPAKTIDNSRVSIFGTAKITTATIILTYRVTKSQVLISLTLPLRQRDIIVHQQDRTNHLDLIRREEPPRASMPSEPKRQTRWRDTDKLAAGSDLGGLGTRELGRAIRRTLFGLAQVVPSHGVELLRVGEDGSIGIDATGWKLDDDARRDDLSVRQLERLKDLALERGWEHC